MLMMPLGPPQAGSTRAATRPSSMVRSQNGSRVQTWPNRVSRSQPKATRSRTGGAACTRAAAPLHPFRDAFAEEPHGPDDQDQDQDSEDDHVLPLAGDVAGGIGLQQADDHAPRHGARDVA